MPCTSATALQWRCPATCRKMIAELERIEPGVTPGYYRFLEDAGRKYRIGREKFVEKNFNRGDRFLHRLQS